MLVDVQQGTPEWLSMRRSMIGGSDAPIIMGLSPWPQSTPYMLWMRKVGQEAEKACSPAMQAGKEEEPAIVSWANEQLGTECKPAVCFHESVPWMMASMDGLDLDKKIVLEAKYVRDEEHEIARSGSVPEHYLAQCQHILEVVRSLGVNTLYYVSRSKTGQPDAIVQVTYQPAYVASMCSQEIEFYHCLTTNTPPPMSDKDYVVREDLKWKEAAYKLLNAKEQSKFWSDMEKQSKEELIKLCDGMNSRGAGVTVHQSRRSGAIDYKAIPELKGVDLEQYRKSPSAPFWCVR